MQQLVCCQLLRKYKDITMKKKLLWLSCLLSCGVMLAMEPDENDFEVTFNLAQQDFAEHGGAQGYETRAGQSSSSKLSQDAVFARELQRQLNGEGNAPVATQGRRASVRRPSSNQLSQDEAYALRLHHQLNGEGNAPVAEQGRRASVRRPNSSQLSQDEAYAWELQ
jgi:hypothetical protein